MPRLTGHLVLFGDAVLTGGWRGYTPLRILDRSSGALRWAESHPTETVLPAMTGAGLLVGATGSRSVRAISVAGGEVWVRERLGGQVAVGPPPRRVSPAAACARGVVRVGQGTVVATRRPGILLLTGPDGAVLARAAVDQQITAVYGLDPDTVLVLGKGEVTAVATRPRARSAA